MNLRLSVIAPTFFVLLATFVMTSSTSQASEPGWYPYVIARGHDRVVIQNTPMHLRPYRPMHFYGNAVRRNYYRGNPAPTRRDFGRLAATIGRRR